VTSRPASTFNTPNALYCAGCNERFRFDNVIENCPRCGADVGSDSHFLLSETLGSRPDAGDGGNRVPGVTDDEEDTLLGRELQVYRCQSLLGAGGMGRVYLALHTGLHRQCALKILSPRLIADDEDYVRHFQQEGRATAAIVHPNIVTVHAIGESDGLHFIEMEFVTGRSLQQAIDDQRRLSPLRATTMAAHIAEGLSVAHRTDIVHRDLKPDNILLTQHRIPKIADFGLAKRIATRANDDDERLAGTPNFMAPELFNGQPATPASDVYALGVSYFLMLTGRVPFVLALFPHCNGQ
jgi:serine/threonine protein kinase